MSRNVIIVNILQEPGQSCFVNSISLIFSDIWALKLTWLKGFSKGFNVCTKMSNKFIIHYPFIFTSVNYSWKWL